MSMLINLMETWFNQSKTNLKVKNQEKCLILVTSLELELELEP